MTTENTTTTEKPAPKRGLSPREEAMEAVANSRRAEFTKETGITIEATEAVVLDDAEAQAEAEERAAEAERQRLEAIANGTATDDDDQARLQAAQEAEARRKEEEAAAAAAAATAAASASAKKKLKVNGREIELTEEELERHAQRGLAADETFQAAAKEREEAERLRREAEELATQNKQQQELQNTQKAQAEATDAFKEATAALMVGDEAKATQALEGAVSRRVTAEIDRLKGELVKSGSTQTVDEAAVVQRVRQQIATESALEQSKKDYPELYSDPDFNALGAAKIKAKREAGLDFVSALRETETEMATKFGWKKSATTGRPSEGTTTRRQEKLERKGELEPPLQTPNVKSGTTEEPVASVSETIREMARQRGQQLH